MLPMHLAASLVNGLWAQMRQRAMWHRSLGIEHRPYDAIDIYTALERELIAAGFNPRDASVHDMIPQNMETHSRNRAVQVFVYLLRSIADTLERDGTLHVYKHLEKH